VSSVIFEIITAAIKELKIANTKNKTRNREETKPKVIEPKEL